MSRLSRMLLKLSMASGVGYPATVYLVSRWLTKPTRGPLRRTPADLGLAFEELTCRTTDGYRLRGWLVEPPAPKATVVLFHGVRNTREQMLSRIAFLVPAGYRCVLFDHRGHGESQGRIASFGYYERMDVRAVLKLAAQRWPDRPRAALGQSMGAAALCYTAQEVVRAVDAVVLESLYRDIFSAFHNRLDAGHYPPFMKRLASSVVRVCGWRLRIKPSLLTPLEHIAEFAPTPLMIVAGIEDRHSTPAEAQSLFDRSNSPGELLLIPGAGHNDVCETGGALYRETLLGFLDRWVLSAGNGHKTTGAA
jgi:alpha-beta hydrolase superfamily lysophospholipase